MHKGVPGGLHDQGTEESPSSACSNLNTDAIHSISSPDQAETCTFGCGHTSCVQEKEGHQTRHLKRSQSLGSGLNKGVFSYTTDLDADFDGRFASGDPNENDYCKGIDSSNKCGSVDSFYCQGSDLKYCGQDTPVRNFDGNHSHLQHENQKSLFSIGDLKSYDEELPGDSYELNSGRDVELGNITLTEHHLFKSHSSPLLLDNGNQSFLSAHELPARSKSFEALPMKGTSQDFKGFQDTIFLQPQALLDGDVDLSSNIAENKSSCQADVFNEYSGFDVDCYCQKMSDQERDAIMQVGPEVQLSDGYEPHGLNDGVDHATEPEKHDIEIKEHEEEHPSQRCDEFIGQELNMRRVQDWLSQIEIHEELQEEEVTNDQGSDPVAKVKDPLPSTNTLKLDARGNPGTEAAYNYISSLSAVSASAQMAGLGLVVIPFLSAFTSLRLLNLSGNLIVRITSGALPRGLHTLNLSRNNISTIEGLRELTRLRILDLSHNRILRIGHGLSACSSLKELYLAGNKISEVEGLHRLLKLSILDLRYNKISTTKCLGQLAANYGSLQAINLDGNPAQRNVGDEQLRKYVVSLLPHLAYYNNHVLKVSSSKEVSDRSSRSSTSHQFDRSLRSEQKRPRRGHLGSTHKTPASSSHGKSSQAAGLAKLPKTPHAPLPPMGSRPGHQQTVDPKLFSMQLDGSIRRIRSESNIG